MSRDVAAVVCIGLILSWLTLFMRPPDDFCMGSVVIGVLLYAMYLLRGRWE